ncbi:MAG: RDD family protein [Acidimicrobiales bacterium]
MLPLAAALSAVADGGARSAVGMALAAAYEITLVSQQGQTLGKMALGIRVVDRSTGALPTVGGAAARWLAVVAGWLVALVLPGIDPLAGVYSLVVLAPALRPPLHLGLHDLAAGTIVTSAELSPG